MASPRPLLSTDRNARNSSQTARAAVLVAALITGVLAAAPAGAGQIHPALRDQLDRVGSTELVSALFILDAQTDLTTLDQSLRARNATRQERHREVVLALQETASRTQPALLAELEVRRDRGEVEGYAAYWISNVVAVRAQRSTIEELANRADVAQAEVNFRPVLIEPIHGIPPRTDGRSEGELRGGFLTPGVRAVKANQVWHELGIRGEGALVANLDTGVDGNHPALSARWRGAGGANPWQECWRDVLGPNSQFPSDGNSHGTHVMGTITGQGVNDSIGVAPAAQWIAANAINQGVGAAFDNDVIDCFQWFADPDGNVNTVDDVPDVLQNSWRINENFGGNYVDCDTRWNAVIDGMEAAGIVVTFSAGNEGPSGTSIGSPPDRATTATNCFSVGAVDATNFANFPYPIASFSSRGPTGCNVVPELKLKPEISAPGVDVYSSVPGGGYQQAGWSGTSMAGPHVAGVVGLMRSINPDIDVQTVKEILMETARDEGTVGEDNTYGWGFIDAFEAVIASATGYGTLSGTVTNASNGGTPIPGAKVKLVEINRVFNVNGVGAYSGQGPEGTYTVEASHASFATESVNGVSLVASQTTNLNFSLDDIGAPAISNVRYPQSVEDENDPIEILAAITDFSSLTAKELHWRAESGPWNVLNMASAGGDDYQADIPGQTIGTTIEFYVRAVDVAANTALEPSGAPVDVYEIFVVQNFFTDNAETDSGWSLSEGSDSNNGRWVRVDPYGTTFLGDQCEPADDHTPNPGVRCFITGQGIQGQAAGNSDVDTGCVTLKTPIIDMSDAGEGIVTYWRWLAMLGNTTANFQISVSSNNGANWIELENVTSNQNSWQQKTFDMSDFITFTSQVRLRFRACDTGASETLLEAGIDDFQILGAPLTTDVEDGETALRTRLFVNQPNPASPETTLRFRLATAGEASLSIYDAGGRKVRSLVAGSLPAGEHSLVWDGRDDAGHETASGVYLYRLEAGNFRGERKLLLLR